MTATGPPVEASRVTTDGTLTILSVSYRSAEFVRFQVWTATAVASGRHTLEWRVIDATPEQRDAERLAGCSHVTVLDSDVAERWRPERVDPRYSPRSVQHAQALNELVASLDEDGLALIADPDCFVLRHNWDAVLVDALERTEADVIGAPWDPRRRLKLGQGIPTPTFMLFRIARLRSLGIDFSPEPYPPRDSPQWSWPLLRWRHHEDWRDTGWRIAEAARAGRLRTLAFDAPVLTPEGGGRLRRAAHRLAPDAMLSRPRGLYRPPYVAVAAPDEIAAAPGGDRYEEYWWDGDPIVCHLRGVSQLGIGFDDARASFWTRRVCRQLGLEPQPSTVVVG